MHQTQVIIMGAGGRMGSMLVYLSQKDPQINLTAMLERQECVDNMPDMDCTHGFDLEHVLTQVGPGVIIDFTQPEATVETARIARNHSCSLVIGTTGLNREQEILIEDVAAHIPVFWTPNMSVGISVLLELLPKLTQALGPAYDPELMEIHHRMKKDAPSGTALKLANAVARAKDWPEDESLRLCREGMIGERPDQEMGVQTLRGGDVVGEHTVYFFGPGERIEITHKASSRETFAQGALRAAKWIPAQKPGRIYTMADLVSLD
ncbi:MAG: 4-hydroxy-tetrahydrodipicolinate reductase [Desulfovermiculus sp.]|nr:4-hydroxy-tetrahydrodipicolinate reductase [Desulfovermiculus sp.]